MDDEIGRWIETSGDCSGKDHTKVVVQNATAVAKSFNCHLRKPLGAGAFGTVWQGAKGHREVAIKFGILQEDALV